ncbi:MAG: hypothetical protein ABIR33_01080 [Pyrinomonadaceae bacterium]
MRPTTTDEQTLHIPVSIFDEVGSSTLTTADYTALLDREGAADKMDTLLASIKWIFIFLPGATAIHFVLMMLSLSVVSGIGPNDPWVQSMAAMVIFSFMVLFGLGRLSDVRYLKVIAAILSSGIMSAVVYNIAAIFIGYRTFGWAMLLSLPITLLFAQLMKTRIDNEEAAS